MCGICGIATNNYLTAKEGEIFETLGLLTVTRGWDSSGLIAISKWNSPVLNRKKKHQQNNNRVGINKTLSILPELAKRENLRKDGLLKTWPDLQAVVGHARAATKGLVTQDNAHPFEAGNIVGVHNGTIHGKFEGTDKFDTDSEALINLINKNGIEEALNEVNKISGAAYALVWFNKADNTLNFIRNDKRPLVFTYIMGASTLIWASTKQILSAGLSFTNTTFYKDHEDKQGSTFQPNENVLMTLHLDGATKVNDIKWTELKIKKVYAASGYRYTSHFNDYWDEDLPWQHNHGETKADTTPTKSVPTIFKDMQLPNKSKEAPKTGTYDLKTRTVKDIEKEINSLDKVIMIEGPGGQQIPLERFKDLVLSGCFQCDWVPGLKRNSSAIEFRKVSKEIKWWNRDTVICKDCAERPWIGNYCLK